MSLFTWTATGSYPAGANLWNGQPLAVAPAQTYFTPSPASNPLKIPAENWNSILGQIAGNLANLQPGALQQIRVSPGPTTVTIPTNVSSILVFGCGGGGGGGGGTGGIGGASNSGVAILGGAGGAGAALVATVLTVTPGAQYDIYVGQGGAGGSGTAGGTGGIGAAIAGGGGDGVDSYITPHGVPGTILALFKGGAGAPGPFSGDSNFSTYGSNTNLVWIPGGGGPTGSLRGGIVHVQVSTTLGSPAPAMRLGDGGAALVNLNTTITSPGSYEGAANVGGSGGNPGAAGAASGSGSGGFYGGGGGGGGGAGPFGVGAAGGNGGDGNNAGTGGSGLSAGAAPTASGAGGGGGGAGGSANVTGGSGGNGSAGGSGAVYIAFLASGG